MAPHAAASGSAPATAISAGPLLAPPWNLWRQRKHQAERGSATAATSGSPPLATKESSTNWSCRNENAAAAPPRLAEVDGSGSRCDGVQEAPHQDPKNVGARALPLAHAIV